MALPEPFDHPSFTTAVGTISGYLLILTVMTVVIFGLPYAFFSVL
jgi:hypothetical protein